METKNTVEHVLTADEIIQALCEHFDWPEDTEAQFKLTTKNEEGDWNSQYPSVTSFDKLVVSYKG